MGSLDDGLDVADDVIEEIVHGWSAVQGCRALLVGVRVREEMANLSRILIPKNFPEWTTRRVHVAEWVEGEKLSQSTADDVNDLVNLGVVTYLTQLLDSGFFHADPHPGNLLVDKKGRLVLIDFGLCAEVDRPDADGMTAAIVHLMAGDVPGLVQVGTGKPLTSDLGSYLQGRTFGVILSGSSARLNWPNSVS